LKEQLPWWIGGPVLGLCVVAIRGLLNARLGVTGAAGATVGVGVAVGAGFAGCAGAGCTGWIGLAGPAGAGWAGCTGAGWAGWTEAGGETGVDPPLLPPGWAFWPC